MKKILILLMLLSSLFIYATDDYITNNPRMWIVNPDEGNWLRWNETYRAFVTGDIDSMTVYGDVTIVGGDLTVGGDLIVTDDMTVDSIYVRSISVDTLYGHSPITIQDTIIVTGNASATTYGSDATVSDAELLYINSLSSNAQTQITANADSSDALGLLVTANESALDDRCLESVFGTAIGTGLTLDSTTLKASTTLQSLDGLTETNGGLPYGTADNAYGWLAAGAAGKVLQANGAAAPTWETVSTYWTQDDTSAYVTTNAKDLEMRNTSVDHLMTQLGSSNAYANFSIVDGSDGGLFIKGFSETADVEGINIGAACVNATPTDYPMKFQVGRKALGTWSPFTGTKLGFLWANNTQEVMTLNTGGQLSIGSDSDLAYHQLNLYDNEPSLCLTDNSINTKITSAATAQDTNAVWIRADDTTPEIGISGGDGDAWSMTIDTSDHAVFQNATAYDFDAAVNITGTASASMIANSAMHSPLLGNGVTTLAITSNIITVTGDGGGNTLGTITGAAIGVYTFIFVDSNVTITDTDIAASNTIDLVGTATNFTSADDTTLTLVYDGTSWFETGRSVN